MRVGNEPQKLSHGYGIAADVGGNDLCGLADQIGFRLWIVFIHGVAQAGIFLRTPR
ncbi:hypothetical protein CEV33_4538 [Brucella grignonensis]|uniref:Uncharacterized protein n=1 Tax=Brucella grignonensis TaxID=94627 RepID=A0A256GNX5_9HYPH|nr:hypothetical protein CEV33_4538 [Brucella grignonensis]